MSISLNIDAIYENLKQRADMYLIIPAAIEDSYDALSEEQLEEITTILKSCAEPIINSIEALSIGMTHVNEETKQKRLDQNYSLSNELYKYLKKHFSEIFDIYSCTSANSNNP